MNAALIKFFEPRMLSGTDYYPFGMPMRVGGDNKYKYGFNGKENDNEVKGGEGLQQDYGMRVYDNRLGRFLSVDPISREYPWYTPYQFAGNTPLLFVDLDGAEEYHYLRLKDGDGKPLLVFVEQRDIIDRKTVATGEYRFPKNAMNDGLIPVYKQVVETNKRKEYIIHDLMVGYIDGPDGGLSGQQRIEYEATTTYSSYDNMINLKDGIDGGQTTLFHAQIGLQNVANESRMNGGAGMAVNLFTKYLRSISSKIAREYGQTLIKSLSRKNRPYSITVVFNKVTKKFYHGKNGGINEGEDVHAEVKKRMPKESREKWKVENCSECDAYNKAMKDKSKWEDLEHTTLKYDSKTGTYVPQAPCNNCQVTFKDKNP